MLTKFIWQHEKRKLENFPDRGNMTEISDTLQAVFFLMGKEKDIKNDTINNVTKLFCCLTYLTLLVSCLPNKKKTPKLFFFQLVLPLSLQNKTSTNFSFFGNKTLPEAVWSSNKWPWNNLDQQGLSDSMTLAGAEEYFKKAESDLECRTDALLNKKQKKK